MEMQEKFDLESDVPSVFIHGLYRMPCGVEPAYGMWIAPDEFPVCEQCKRWLTTLRKTCHECRSGDRATACCVGLELEESRKRVGIGRAKRGMRPFWWLSEEQLQALREERWWKPIMDLVSILMKDAPHLLSNVKPGATP